MFFSKNDLHHPALAKVWAFEIPEDSTVAMKISHVVWWVAIELELRAEIVVCFLTKYACCETCFFTKKKNVHQLQTNDQNPVELFPTTVKHSSISAAGSLSVNTSCCSLSTDSSGMKLESGLLELGMRNAPPTKPLLTTSSNKTSTMFHIFCSQVLSKWKDSLRRGASQGFGKSPSIMLQFIWSLLVDVMAKIGSGKLIRWNSVNGILECLSCSPHLFANFGAQPASAKSTSIFKLSPVFYYRSYFIYSLDLSSYMFCLCIMPAFAEGGVGVWIYSNLSQHNWGSLVFLRKSLPPKLPGLVFEKVAPSKNPQSCFWKKSLPAKRFF